MATIGTPGALPVVPPTAGSLGQGIAYPLAANQQGRLVLASGVPLVEMQIQAVCETARKERVMLPQFGAGMGEFEPSDMGRQVILLKQQIKEYVDAVDTVDVEAEDGPGAGEVTVKITYTLKSDDDERTLTVGSFSVP